MGPAVLSVVVVDVFHGVGLSLRAALCVLLSNSMNAALYQGGVDFLDCGFRKDVSHGT